MEATTVVLIYAGMHATRKDWRSRPHAERYRNIEESCQSMSHSIDTSLEYQYRICRRVVFTHTYILVIDFRFVRIIVRIPPGGPWPIAGNVSLARV